LLQQSVARQVRVIVMGEQVPLVTVLWTAMVTLVPQQASEAVGWPKFQGVPAATVMLVGQTSVGGWVSTTETSCVQTELLLQQSVTRQTPAHSVLQTVGVPTTLVLSNW
jgi:hypothetical protein